MRHWCVFSCVVCHWHRFFFLMVCAPHLSFLVTDFSLIIVWIARPRVGCGGELGPCIVFVGGCCDAWGWFIWGVGGDVIGNIVVAY